MCSIHRLNKKNEKKFRSLPQLRQACMYSKCIRKVGNARFWVQLQQLPPPLSKSQAFREHSLFPCNHSLIFCNSLVLLTGILYSSSTHDPQSNFLEPWLRKAKLGPLMLCHTHWWAGVLPSLHSCCGLTSASNKVSLTQPHTPFCSGMGTRIRKTHRLR